MSAFDSYHSKMEFVELRKRLTILEARVTELEPKPKPKPTIPSLEKARPTPQERAEERELLQAEARKLEEKEREERLEGFRKLGLHGSEAAGQALRETSEAPPVPFRPTNLKPRSSYGG